MAIRKRTTADIALTLGINPEFDARRLAAEFQQGFKQAGVANGIDYNESFTKEVDKMPPKVARAMRRTAAAFGQVEEAAEKVSNRLREAERDQEAFNAATERYNRIAADAASTDEDRAQALADLTAQQDRYNQSTRALITERAKFNRANQNTANSLGLVDAALDSIADNDGAGKTLLTVGKYISAIRASAIPLLGAGVAVGGSAIISSLAALTQALWMVPAAGGAAVSAFGSLKIATLGFSDAVENMGDAEKFYEALQNLSPNAQQAALSIQALTEPLKQLKNTTQDALFADFAPMINQLAQQYLPMIEQLTSGIANAFNSGMKSVFNQLMTPDTQAVLQSMVDNLVEGFERLAPAAGPFVDAITRIMETGSRFLPEMGEAIANAAEDFAAFIREAQESGDLERWFREGIDTANKFWQIIKDVGKAFADLSPAGQKVLPEIQRAINGLTKTVPTLVENLNKIVAPIARFVDAVGSAIQAFDRLMDKIKRGVDWLGRIGGLGGRLFNFGAPLGTTGDDIANIGKPNNRLNINSPSAALRNIFGQNPDTANRAVYGQAIGSSAYFGDSGKGVTPPAPAPNPKLDDILLGGSQAGGSSLFGLGADGIADRNTPGSPIPPVPAGGYPMPPAPVDDSGSGGGKAPKEKEPPFTADPSTYSIDSIPIGSFFGDAPAMVPSASAAAAPLAAEAPMPVMDAAPQALPPINMAAIPQLLGTNPAISAVGVVAQQLGVPIFSGIAGPNSPTKRPFDGGWHDTGQAGDFSNGSAPTPEMRNMALWLASNFGPLIEELIYNDDMGGVGIDKGVPVDAAAAFGPTAHRNHIHLAVRDELVPQFLQAMQENLLGGFAGDAGYFEVDQGRVTSLQQELEEIKRRIEIERMAYRKLEASGTADQLQMARARDAVLRAEADYFAKQKQIDEERLGTYKKFDSDFTKVADDTTGSLKSTANGLSDIGAALANDFGISEGLPGIAKWLTTFLANLAFAPMLGALSAVSAVGNANSGTTGASGLIGMFAPPVGPMDPSAMGPNPLGGGVGSPLPGQAQNMQAAQYPLMKFDNGGMLPPGGMGINLTNKPEPVLTGEQWAQIQTSMQSATPVQHGTSGGATPGPQAGESTSRAPAAVGGGGFTGLGGMPMQAINTAISAAGFGLDAFAPGAGQAASAAAQIGIQLANRAAGFAGQVAGIAVGGLMETFLPNNSAVADPAKSWIGKIASGISGARPAVPNQANSSAPAKPPAMPQQATATGGGGPVVLIENMVNQTNDGGQTIANQVARQAQTGYLSRMGAR